MNFFYRQKFLYPLFFLYTLLISWYITENKLTAISLSIIPLAIYIVPKLVKNKKLLFRFWIILIPFTSVLSVGISNKKLSIIDSFTFFLGAIVILSFLTNKYEKSVNKNSDIVTVIFSLLGILIYSVIFAKYGFSKFSGNVIADWAQGNSVYIKALISDIRIISPLFTILFTYLFIRKLGDLFIAFKFFALGVLISCSYGLYEYFIRISGLGQSFLLPGHSSSVIQGYGTFRISGPFGEPGYYAGFLVVSLFFSFLIRHNKIIERKKINFLILLQFSNLLLTFSSVGWLSFIIGTVYLLVVKKNIKSLLFLFVLGIVAFIAISTNDIAMQVVSKPFIHQENASLNSQSERMNTALAALQIFFDYPIFGIGYGMFGLLYETYNPMGITIKYGQPIVNNIYLDVLSSFGIIGSIFFLIIFIVLIRSLFELKRNDTDKNYYHFISSGLLSIFIIFFAYPTFNFNFHWFFFGILLVLPKLVNANNKNSEEGH